jgi:hypothetical protein
MIPDVCDEVHGVNDAHKLDSALGPMTQRVIVTTDGLWIRLAKSENNPAGLSPAQARYLAQKLNRLATIVDARRKAAGHS